MERKGLGMAESKIGGEPLTQDEIDALPGGTEIEVIWSGGNGPHRYHVSKKHGRTAAHVSHATGTGYDHSLDLCGKHPLTEVRIVEST